MNCRPIGGSVAAARARAKRQLDVKRVNSFNNDASRRGNVTQTVDDGSVSIELHHADDEQVAVGSSLYGVIQTTDGEFDIRVGCPSSKHEDQGEAVGATQVTEACCSTSSCPKIARKCWGYHVSEDCCTRVSQPINLGVGIQPHASSTEQAAKSSADGMWAELCVLQDRLRLQTRYICLPSVDTDQFDCSAADALNSELYGNQRQQLLLSEQVAHTLYTAASSSC